MGRGGLIPWILSKDVVLAVQYKVYLVSWVISLVDAVLYVYGHLHTYDSKSDSAPNFPFLNEKMVLEILDLDHKTGLTVLHIILTGSDTYLPDSNHHLPFHNIHQP